MSGGGDGEYVIMYNTFLCLVWQPARARLLITKNRSGGRPTRRHITATRVSEDARQRAADHATLSLVGTMRRVGRSAADVCVASMDGTAAAVEGAVSKLILSQRHVTDACVEGDRRRTAIFSQCVRATVSASL